MPQANKIKNWGPGSQQAALAATVAAKRRLFHEEIKNSTKPQTLRRATAANYRAPDVTPLDVPPNGPKHDTWSNGLKDGVVAP